MTVTRRFAQQHHLGVGDTVTIRLPTPAEIAQSESNDSVSLSGPKVQARIVGVVETSFFVDVPGSPGNLQFSPGLAKHYPAQLLGNQADPGNPNFPNALIRLKTGEAGIPAFQRELAKVTGRSDIELSDQISQARDFQRHLSFEAQCLVAFALAVLAASAVLIGTAVARFTAGSVADLSILRAIGLTPRQTVVAATTGPALIAIVGAVAGVAGAVLASPLFPIGSARPLEPDPGVHADWLVLLGVAAGVVLLLVLGAAGSAAAALGAQKRAQTPRRSTVALAASRAGLGIPFLVGTRFAFEPGRGRTAVSIRPALAGAVVGVLGVVAAFTFAAGVTDAGAHPQRYGQTFQLSLFTGYGGQSFVPSAPVVQTLVDSPDVTGVDDARIAVANGPSTGDEASASVSLYEYKAGPKPLPVVITSGRMVHGADEIVLAPRSLIALHKHVGDQVTLTGDRKQARTFTITGEGLVPIGSHNNYSDGGWLTTAGYDSLSESFKFSGELVAVRHGADVHAVSQQLAAALNQRLPQAGGQIAFESATVPTELYTVRRVQSLPIALGLFLALLALAAVGHALATAVRRRRTDIAVLRALGMTRWQSRAVVVIQASLLALVGLVFGIPLGLALGRVLWRTVTTFTPLEYVTPVALWVLVLIAPIALLAVNALAAWPGRQAARLHVAQILRAE